MRRHNKESCIIKWLNKHDYDFKITHEIFSTTFTISTPNLKWCRVKARTQHKLGKLVYNVKNLLYALWGYKLVDAQYNGDIIVFSHVEDISGTTTQALVPRKGNGRGWALRFTVNENGTLVAGKDGEPIKYKEYHNEMSWM